MAQKSKGHVRCIHPALSLTTQVHKNCKRKKKSKHKAVEANSALCPNFPLCENQLSSSSDPGPFEMVSGHLESQTGEKKKTWNLMKHGDKPRATDHLLPSCLSRPPLLDRQGWAKQQVVQKRSLDMGFTNLCLSDICTGKHEQQIPNFKL